MARQGLFGELLHLHGGYQHDLRAVVQRRQAIIWRRREFGEKGLTGSQRHQPFRAPNGDLYPTHIGLGPINNMININRGNRLMSLHGGHQIPRFA